MGYSSWQNAYEDALHSARWCLFRKRVYRDSAGKWQHEFITAPTTELVPVPRGVEAL
jgi:hypothetical protein